MSLNRSSHISCKYTSHCTMAGSSRGATKRLMTELQSYQKDPNAELLDLGPADEDVMHWRAVMKGVDGTAYEGTSIEWLLPSLAPAHPLLNYPLNTILTSPRRHMAPRHPHPSLLP